MDGSIQQSLIGLQAASFEHFGHNPSSEWSRWQRRKSPVARRSVQSHGRVSGKRSEKLARLEAAFFVADAPLSTRKLSQYALLVDVSEVKELIEELNRYYQLDDSAFQIERVASGYQLLTRPRFSHWLDQLHQRTAELKLSSPAMETLTIVAYRQPITRADIEAVRGVQCSEILKQLMERGLVKIGGEDDSLGRPYLYITTRMFLELFGLRTLEDLPDAADLRLRPEQISEAEGESEDPDADAEEEALEDEGDWEDDDQESAA
ncbi:MAG: SMC-Scp complex subunit ScpB [Planctomycetaceae bacterium]|nr:SMC-Scp complex subunit ScpB [Planctomycetaceae bacterium]